MIDGHDTIIIHYCYNGSNDVGTKQCDDMDASKVIVAVVRTITVPSIRRGKRREGYISNEYSVITA